MDENIITPESKEISHKDVYGCTKCQSEIEIFLIDNNNIRILFQCLNKDEKLNHGVINLEIRDYINDMLKNTYLYDKCSKCNTCQKDKSYIIFNYCTICKKVLCDKCSSNHTKEDKKGHLIIKNNEKSIYCSIHPKKENKEFCLDCKTHLCNECLKSRVHIMHRKNNLLEMKPSDKEVNLIKEYIDELKKEKENLEKERDIKLLNLKNKENEEKNNIKNLYLEYIDFSKQKLKDEIYSQKTYLKSELKRIKNEYMNKIKLTIDKFTEYLKNLEHKSKNEIENYKKNSYKSKIDKIEIKYNNDYNCFLNYYNKKVNDITDLLNINEIINNAYLKYENNYYNNLNFLTILSCSKKSDGDNIIYQNLNLEREEKQNLKNEIEKLKAENLEKSNKNLHLIEENKILKNEKKEYLSKYNELQDNIMQLQNKNIDFSEYQKELNEILIKSNKDITKKKPKYIKRVEGKKDDKENQKVTPKPKKIVKEEKMPQKKYKAKKEPELKLVYNKSEPILFPGFLEKNKNEKIKVNIDEIEENRFEDKIVPEINKFYKNEELNFEPMEENQFEEKEPIRDININKQKPQQIIEENDYLLKIKEFRKMFSLSKDDYSDEKLLNVLKRAKFNYNDAFMILFS